MRHENRVSETEQNSTRAVAHNPKSAGISRSVIPPLQKASAGKQNKDAGSLQRKPTDIKPFQPNVLQLKESDQLNPAGFNMIGETHTLYENRNSRMYDAKNIKKVMGPDTAYYTEDILKLNKDDHDYADPIDLTLEYTITFMKQKITRINELIPHFNDIQLPDDEEETVEDNLDLPTEDETTNVDEDLKDAKLAAADVAPQLLDDFKKDTVIAYIKQKDYRVEILELLATSKAWEEIPAYQDESIIDNAFVIMEEIETLISEKTEDKDEGGKQSDSDEETPVNDKTNTEPDQDIEQQEHLRNSMAELIVLIKSLYNESNSLLIRKLMLYADLMEKTNGTVGPGGFKFDVSRIPDVLELWKKVADIKENADAFSMMPMVFFPKVIHEARTTFPALIGTLDEAILNEGKNREREPLRKLRSLQMHKAAEALKDQKIAWKVGDKHIADIREIEKEQATETGYTYISVENFSQRYYNAEELKHFKGTDEDLGPEYLEAKTKNDKIVKDRYKTFK